MIDFLCVKAKTFNPSEFLGENWTVWKGPISSDGLLGEEDICPKSLEVTKIYLSKMVFMYCLKEGEDSISGEDKIRRLGERQHFIGYGPDAFLSLWVDYEVKRKFSFLERIYFTCVVASMDFPGTVLRSPEGYRHTLYLYRSGEYKWNWGTRWIGGWWPIAPSVGCVC